MLLHYKNQRGDDYGTEISRPLSLKQRDKDRMGSVCAGAAKASGQDTSATCCCSAAAAAAAAAAFQPMEQTQTMGGGGQVSVTQDAVGHVSPMAQLDVGVRPAGAPVGPSTAYGLHAVAVLQRMFQTLTPGYRWQHKQHRFARLTGNHIINADSAHKMKHYKEFVCVELCTNIISKDPYFVRVKGLT